MRRISLALRRGDGGHLAIGGYLLREPIILLAAGPSFEGAAIIFSILFLSECMGLAGLHLNALMKSARDRLSSVPFDERPAVISGALAGLTGPAGSTGIAAASLAGSMLMYVGMSFVARRELHRLNRSALSSKSEIHG